MVSATQEDLFWKKFAAVDGAYPISSSGFLLRTLLHEGFLISTH